MKIEITDKSLKVFEQVLNKDICDAVARAVYLSTGQVANSLDRYTPMKTGALRRSKEISVNITDAGKVAGLNVNYHVPYAKYQYYKDYNHYTTPDTGSHWGEKAHDEIINTLINNVKAVLHGR